MFNTFTACSLWLQKMFVSCTESQAVADKKSSDSFNQQYQSISCLVLNDIGDIHLEVSILPLQEVVLFLLAEHH